MVCSIYTQWKSGKASAGSVGWHLAWGFVHPQLLDREWVNLRAGNMNLVVDTDPYDLDGIRNGRVVPRWDGSELLIAYRTPVRN